MPPDAAAGGHEVTLDLELVLPDFRYRAVAADGIVEHEICPVFFAWVESGPEPPPSPHPRTMCGLHVGDGEHGKGGVPRCTCRACRRLSGRGVGQPLQAHSTAGEVKQGGFT